MPKIAGEAEHDRRGMIILTVEQFDEADGETLRVRARGGQWTVDSETHPTEDLPTL